MPKKQKEKKYEMSVKESAQWTLKAIKLLHSLAPGEMELEFANDISNIIFNYVNIYLMARLIDELATRMRPEKLVLFAVLIIVCLIFDQVFYYIFFHIKQYKGIFRGEKKQYMLNKKLTSLDFADAEGQEIRDRFFKIKQDQDWLNMGIDGAYNILESFIGGAVMILGGVVLSVSFFFTKVPDGTKGAWFLNSPLLILAVTAIIAIITKLATASGIKAYNIESRTNDASSKMNRMQRHTEDILKDENRALDMRIYDQRSQIIAMRREAVDHGYAAMVKKYSRGSAGLLRAAQSFAVWLPDSVMFFAVGLKALAGAFTIGAVTQYVQALTRVSDCISEAIFNLSNMRINAPYIKKVFDFMELPNKMYQGSLTTEKRSDRQYDVEFRDVSFRYPTAKNWALRHVNIKFRVGTRLAVVGENGSGKSTFIKLLCRLYDPQEGEILLNGIDIKKYNPKDYMDVFSVVFQAFQLLPQPLGANVAGSSRYDEKRVRFAKRVSGNVSNRFRTGWIHI